MAQRHRLRQLLAHRQQALRRRLELRRPERRQQELRLQGQLLLAWLPALRQQALQPVRQRLALSQRGLVMPSQTATARLSRRTRT